MTAGNFRIIDVRRYDSLRLLGAGRSHSGDHVYGCISDYKGCCQLLPKPTIDTCPSEKRGSFHGRSCDIIRFTKVSK